MTLRLQRRRFRFALLQPLRTASGELRERCGWLLRLENDCLLYTSDAADD